MQANGLDTNIDSVNLFQKYSLLKLVVVYVSDTTYMSYGEQD